MKGLIATLVLCGALSVLAGNAVAAVDLVCGLTECKYNEELGPDKTKTFHAYCTGESMADYNMACHAVKGTTCTDPFSMKNYWSCSCTNWNATERKTVSIDVLCKD